MISSKRGRGRPAGPAKYADDVDLVGFVRDRKRGVNVEQALEEYRRKRGAKVGTILQLKKRYERIASAYPGGWREEIVRIELLGGFPVKRRVFDHKPSAAISLLTGREWPTRKPSKY